MTDGLREHEANLVAFGRYMVAPERRNPETTDMAEVGRLAALVINGLPVVRAAIQESRAGGGLDVERLRRAWDNLTVIEIHGIDGDVRRSRSYDRLTPEAIAAAYAKDTGSS